MKRTVGNSPFLGERGSDGDRKDRSWTVKGRPREGDPQTVWRAMEVARALRMAAIGASLVGVASAARLVEKANVAKVAWKASEEVRGGQERRDEDTRGGFDKSRRSRLTSVGCDEGGQERFRRGCRRWIRSMGRSRWIRQGDGAQPGHGACRDERGHNDEDVEVDDGREE